MSIYALGSDKYRSSVTDHYFSSPADEESLPEAQLAIGTPDSEYNRSSENEDILLYQKLQREEQNTYECACLTDDTVKLIFMCFSEEKFTELYKNVNIDKLMCRSFIDKERRNAFSHFSMTCKKAYMLSHEIPHERFNGLIKTNKVNDFVLIRSLPFRLCLNEIQKQRNSYPEIANKLHEIYTRGIDPKNIEKLVFLSMKVFGTIYSTVNINKNEMQKITNCLTRVFYKSIINKTADCLGESPSTEDYKSAVDSLTQILTLSLCPSSEVYNCPNFASLGPSQHLLVAVDLRRTLYERHSVHFQKLAEEFKKPEDKIVSIQQRMDTSLRNERTKLEAECEESLQLIYLIIIKIKKKDGVLARLTLQHAIKELKPFAVFPDEVIFTLDHKDKIETFLAYNRDKLTGGRLYEIQMALENLFVNAEKKAKQLGQFYAELSRPVPDDESKKEKRTKALEIIIND